MIWLELRNLTCENKNTIWKDAVQTIKWKMQIKSAYFTCLKCPWIKAIVQRVLLHLDRIVCVKYAFQTNIFS